MTTHRDIARGYAALAIERAWDFQIPWMLQVVHESNSEPVRQVRLAVKMGCGTWKGPYYALQTVGSYHLI